MVSPVRLYTSFIIFNSQVLSHLIDGEMNYEKLQKFTTSARVTLERADVKALLAALNFIFTNATKFRVDAQILQAELEQLGLPSDVCKSICRCYRASQTELYSVMAGRTLKIGGVSSVEWRVDYVFATKTSSEVEQPNATISLFFPEANQVNGGMSNISFDCSGKKLLVMIQELKTARAAMELDLAPLV